MGFLDSIRAAANAGRRVADKLVREATVTVYVYAYDKPVNTANAAPTTTTTTVITPNPKVEEIGIGDPSYFGGGLLADSGGIGTAAVYRISCITPPFAGGGYETTDLMPTVAVNKRVLLLLTGPSFSTNGEFFKVVDFKRTATQITLTVQRVSTPT